VVDDIGSLSVPNDVHIFDGDLGGGLWGVCGIQGYLGREEREG